jgi:hypothetical protein
MRHVSCGSESCLSAGRVPTLSSHAQRLPVGLKHKKTLPGLPTQPGSPVPNGHTHVSKVGDARAIMGLQDMQADGAFNACKACIQAATVLRWHY